MGARAAVLSRPAGPRPAVLQKHRRADEPIRYGHDLAHSAVSPPRADVRTREADRSPRRRPRLLRVDLGNGMAGGWALVIGMTLASWTGAAQAIIEARANPLEPLRVTAVLAAGAVFVIRWLWRPQA